MIAGIIAGVLIRRSTKALNRGDLAAYLKRWSDDVTFVCQGKVSVAGTFEGKEDIVRWHERLLEQFPRRSVKIKNIYVRNPFGLLSNDIAVEWEWSATNKDGIDSQNNGVSIMKLRNGATTFVKQFVFDSDEQRQAWGE